MSKVINLEAYKESKKIQMSYSLASAIVKMVETDMFFECDIEDVEMVERAFEIVYKKVI